MTAPTLNHERSSMSCYPNQMQQHSIHSSLITALPYMPLTNNKPHIPEFIVENQLSSLHAPLHSDMFVNLISPGRTHCGTVMTNSQKCYDHADSYGQTVKHLPLVTLNKDVSTCIQDNGSITCSKEELLYSIDEVLSENVALKQRVQDLEVTVSKYKQQIDQLQTEIRTAKEFTCSIDAVADACLVENNTDMKKEILDNISREASHKMSSKYSQIELTSAKGSYTELDSEGEGKSTDLDDSVLVSRDENIQSKHTENRHKIQEIKRSHKLKSSMCGRRRNKSPATSSNVKWYQCAFCEKRFLSELYLREHMGKHTGEKPFDCPFCGKKYSSLETFKRHKKSMHEGTGPTKHFCEICAGSYQNMWAHLRVHQGIKMYSCTICGHKCSSSSNLKEHQLKHSGERSFQCAVCGKLSGTASNHKKHVKRHSSNKSYHCKVCDRRFIDTTGLKRHSLIHTREKAFSCDDCQRQFRLKTLLNQHILIHTGERKFNCPTCDKRFVQRSHMNTHMKLIHGKKQDNDSARKNEMTKGI